MSFRISLLLVGLLLSLSLRAEAKLDVVTTTSDLAAVTQAVGGAHVNVRALALPTQDPHWVDPRPHLALELAKADLVIRVGLDLEVGWLPTLLTASRNGNLQPGARGHLDASQFVTLLEVPKGRVDRSQGDVHPGGNPHYLLDPRRAARVASGIAARLALLDPANEKQYRSNADDFNQKLSKWRQHWETQLSFLKGKKLISYHRSMTYLGDWLGFETPLQIEPKPGIPPHPGHVSHVIAFGTQAGVELVLQESHHPVKTSQLIADRIGARLVVLPGGPDFRGGESYIGFIQRCVALLAKAPQ